MLRLPHKSKPTRAILRGFPSEGAKSINKLTTLANKYRSDKGTRYGSPPHRYTYLYDLILGSSRDLELDFLEIGLAAGGPEVGGPIERQVASPSAQIWLEYFPLAHIYQFDISDFSHIKHPRFTFVHGDGQSACPTWNGWETRLRALTSSSMMRLMPPIISSLPSNIYIQGCGAGGTTLSTIFIGNHQHTKVSQFHCRRQVTS